MGRIKHFHKRVTIRLSDEQYEKLYKLADAEGMSISSYIRISINFMSKKLKQIYGVKPQERPDLRMNYKW